MPLVVDADGLNLIAMHRELADIVKKQGEIIELTKTEFLILKLLMESPGRIYTKQQIYDYVWGDEYIADDNTLMVHISNLRGKIEDNSRVPMMLKTVKGLGYKFEKDQEKL